MIIFGRAIKDFIPVLPGKYRPHNTWREMLEDRETALRNRHMKDCERLTEHTKRLLPLVVGDCVRIQNQTGNHPKKWDKTGVVVEVKQFDQYVVRVDGSGRGTLRNRQFLRKYTPVLARPEPTMATRWTAPQPYIPPTPQSSPTTLPATTKGPLENPPTEDASTAPAVQPATPIRQSQPAVHQESTNSTPVPSTIPLRPSQELFDSSPSLQTGRSTPVRPPATRSSTRSNKAKLPSHFDGFEMK